MAYRATISAFAGACGLTCVFPAAAQIFSPPEPVAEDVGELQWISKPDIMQVSVIAMENNAYRTADVVLECTMRRGWAKSCVVIEETPPGRNFKRVAIEVIKLYHAASKDSMGLPIEGRVVRFPIRFTERR